MGKNFNITKWLKENHPAIFQEFERIKMAHRKQKQREYSAEIYRLAKIAKAQE